MILPNARKPQSSSHFDVKEKSHPNKDVFEISCENSHLVEHNKTPKNGSQFDLFQKEAISCVGLMAK